MARAALLGFVFVTLGYAWGRDAAQRRLLREAPPLATAPDAASPAVTVYYLHAPVRCETCTHIEQVTESVLADDFADAYRDGRLRMRRADFLDRRDLATRYGVVASCVVVAREADGRELGFERLDGVWERAGDEPALRAYIAGAVRAALDGGEAHE